MISRATCAVMTCLIALVMHACLPSKSTDKNASEAAGTAGQAGVASVGFLVNQSTAAYSARQQMDAQKSPDAYLMDYVANNTVALWLVGIEGNIQQTVKSFADAAIQANATALLVAYNIPNRDCGQFSAGGTGADSYKTWISGIVKGIGSANAMVILEPDAIADISCLSDADKNARFALLSYAVTQLKAAPHTRVYIDAGHPNWLSPSDAATRLKASGIQGADGFALNTSNYFSNPANISYGQQISALVGKGFVVDTSRNGNGPTSDNQWCNPSGRALGVPSTMQTGVHGIDAYVWIKNPGESDGSCNGGPAAGTFWPDKALELARNAKISVNQANNPMQTPVTTTPVTTIPVTTTANPPAGSNGMWCDAYKAGACWPYCKKPANGVWGYEPELGGLNGSCHAPVVSGGVATQAPAPLGDPVAQGQLQVSLQVKSTWADGYCADIIIKNTGTTPVSGWTLVLNSNAASINQTWNLNGASGGASTTYTPVASWNGSIPAGGTVDQQGFCANLAEGEAKVSVASITSN